MLIGGGVATLTLVTVAVRRLDYEQIPQAAVLAAALFVASLVSVPVGPSSVHLLLNGLMGMVLGWAAVPAILVALLLQAVFFGYGGLLVLGVNTFNLALPALLCALLYGPALRRAQGGNGRPLLLGAAAGATGVALTAGLLCGALALSGPELVPAAQLILLTYLPLLVAEAAVTGAVCGFLLRVAPELLFPVELADG